MLAGLPESFNLKQPSTCILGFKTFCPHALAPAEHNDEANYDANCNEGRAKISKLRKGEAKEEQGTKFTCKMKNC